MKNEYFDKLGDECFNKLKELNPKGGIKEFIRIAVEFGYNKAIKNNVVLTDISEECKQNCNDNCITD